MPRVNFVKKARKDIPGTDIKKGDSYYWWKFRFGGKHVSKTQPKPSQLTQSEFKSAMYDIEERISNLSASGTSIDELKTEIESIAEDIRSLGEEQTDKLSNMPEGLQQGSTGEMLQGRYDSCEDMAGQLDNIDTDVEEPGEDASEEDKAEYERRLQEIVDEAQGVSYDGE